MEAVKRSSFSNNKSVCTVFAILVAALAIYSVHIPLPEDLADREKMHIFETVMRLVYFYPMKAFHMFGVEWQLKWTRSTLNILSHLLGPWTDNDADLYIIDTDFDGVPVRVYHPKTEPSNPGAIIFIHGGGFVLMNAFSYDGLTREMARKANMVLVSIDYRLAPEHVFPAGLNDCEKAVRYFLKEGHSHFGVDPSRVVIMGDSAGGNLAAVTARHIRDSPDVPDLKLQVLLYPVMQYVDLLTPSYQLYYKEYAGTSLLDPESIARWVMMYLGVNPTPYHMDAVLSNNHTVWENKAANYFENLRHDHLPEEFLHEDVYHTPPSHYGDNEVYKLLEPFLFNPDFSPLMAPDLEGLPQSLVVTCQYDILRDEGFWYAKRLRESNVDVLWKHYDAAFHAILNFHSELDLGAEVLRDVVRYVAENV